MVACMKGHIDTAKVLVDHGAIIDDSNSVKFLSLSIYSISYHDNYYNILFRWGSLPSMWPVHMSKLLL